MLGGDDFVASAERSGVRVFTGVPCSYFGTVLETLDDRPDLPYVAATGEGEAVAVAAGAALVGELPMVLMQNSGLGNAVNPLTSLVLTFELPMILLISERGMAEDDAPQHRIMGQITTPLLELMGLHVVRLPPDPRSAWELLGSACREATLTSSPLGLIVAKGTFAPAEDRIRSVSPPSPEPVAVRSVQDPSSPPARLKILRALASGLTENDLVVVTTGVTARELYAIADRRGTFYMVGSMGCASGIGLGVALCRRERRVIVVDGDGALLMRLGLLAVIGSQQPPGLIHVLLDNGSYETTGGQATAGSEVDFARIAAGAGYRAVETVRGCDELVDRLRAFESGAGPAFYRVPIATGSPPDLRRVQLTPLQIRDRFARAAEGRPAPSQGGM